MEDTIFDFILYGCQLVSYMAGIVIFPEGEGYAYLIS